MEDKYVEYINRIKVIIEEIYDYIINMEEIKNNKKINVKTIVKFPDSNIYCTIDYYNGNLDIIFSKDDKNIIEFYKIGNKLKIEMNKENVDENIIEYLEKNKEIIKNEIRKNILIYIFNLVI